MTTKHYTPLKGFLSLAQARALGTCLAGEEGDYFETMLTDLAERIRTMPKTYEQDGKSDQAIVSLHYFKGGADWYITEKDVDTDGEGQLQAFGLADLFGDGGELGYISIAELVENNVELDLYWTPKPLAEIKKGA